MNITSANFHTSLKPAADATAPTQEALRQVCEEFASVFWEQLLSGLRRTVPKGGLFPESAGEDIFQGMLDTEYARSIARSEGSLAEVLFRQLKLASSEDVEDPRREG